MAKLKFPRKPEMPELHIPCPNPRSSEDTRDNREAQEEWEADCRELTGAWEEECAQVIESAIQGGDEIDWDVDVPADLRKLKHQFEGATNSAAQTQAPVPPADKSAPAADGAGNEGDEPQADADGQYRLEF